MAKNRFAQPLYGKIIYIYETYLTRDDLPTVFDPSTYWIDVTGIDCEVGYILAFTEDGGLRFIPPPKQELTIEEEKQKMLEKVNNWTSNKITGGFDSNVSGELVCYDSDKDTQLTMQGIALNVNTPLFIEKYPNGCPVRGYKYNNTNGEVSRESEKTIFMLSAEQVLKWCADLSLHIGECKKQGWVKQSEVNKCTTVEELNKIVLE